MYYKIGTITLTNGSTVVTGAGTSFVDAKVQAGMALQIPGGSLYEIASVSSNTALVLARPWLGATVGGQAYDIVPIPGRIDDLAVAAAELIASFADVRDGIGAGLMPDGSVAAPGLRFANSQGTGLRRVGSDIFALVTAGSDRLVIDAAGNVLLGAASGSVHTIQRGSLQDDWVLNVTGAAYESARFYSAAITSYNATASAMKLATNSISGRSLNAAGTLNASGADYAEYMTKADGCGEIMAGDVCGIDRDGMLTQSWSEAHSFVIKSTDPAYVGGDRWAEVVGARPEQAPGESDADFDERFAPWSDALEIERQKVDRIAFAGQVPVNVSSGVLAACGEALEDGEPTYLIAVANSGAIAAEAVREADMTLPLYMRRIGKLWTVRAGRPWVDVQHG